MKFRGRSGCARVTSITLIIYSKFSVSQSPLEPLRDGGNWGWVRYGPSLAKKKPKYRVIWAEVSVRRKNLPAAGYTR